MKNLGDSLRGGTLCLAKAGLAEGTNSATIKVNAPNGAGVDFAIDGIAYHKADTDNIAVTAHAVQAALTQCLYLVQIDSAGTVSTKKGTAQTTLDLAAGLAFLEWPKADSGKCAIGGYKVKCANAATYTNGTTDHSATDVTVTYYDFMAVPSSPLASS